MEKDKLEELKLLSAKIRKDVLEMLEKRGYVNILMRQSRLSSLD